MKSLALAVVMAVALGAVGGVAAQQVPSSSPAPAPAPAESKNTNVTPAQPGTPSPDVKTDTRTDSSKDDVAASPRTAPERTTIFGLTPVAAVVIAAALLVIVILAILAMTRTDDTYIDIDRRGL